MLHGNIEVNGHTIGEWQAVNNGTVPGMDYLTEYQCKVTYTNLMGYPMEADFVVYDERITGALHLAAKVLGKAVHHLKRVPTISEQDD